MKKILSILLICFSFSATAQNTAPNFMVTDISGETHDLYEYLGQGKYVVVNFMGTWCGPCQGVAEDYGLGFVAFGCNNIDVIFIDIDTGSDTQACIDFNEEYMTGIQGLPIVSGNDGGGNAAHNTYGITGVPTIITISPIDSTYTETHLGFYTNLAQEGIEPVSPTEYCQFDYTINGCTDQNAINYNLSANADNGSCEYSSVIYDSLYNTIDEATTSLSSLQQALDTWNTTIDLSAGWNMFGYGCPSPIDVAEGLSNHTESIDIVKDNNGNVYMPEFGFNGIGDLTPGFGYQIKLTEAIEGFSLCDWYVNDIPEDNIVSLQDSLELINSQIGCTDSLACNFDIIHWYDDGSCFYSELGYDCEGDITIEIGDVMEGGYLFYIDETGEHGLVAAMEDIEGFYQWGCYGEYVDGADGISIGTGYQNTMDIVNQGCSTENGGITAAQVALDAEINGYSDWYLPSKDELFEIYNTIGNGSPEGNIGGFAYNSYYWSSSEYNNIYAWYFSFYDVIMYDDNKNSTNRVRVIRAF